MTATEPKRKRGRPRLNRPPQAVIKDAFALRVDPVLRFAELLRPPKLRSYRQFAEDEIILPDGPRKGMKFSTRFSPMTGLILDMFESGKYRRFFGSGSVQSGKTLVWFGIPLIYNLFELQESVIVGVPTMEMAHGIYHERLLPIVRKTRFANEFPETGAGSRGGPVTFVQFMNGTSLRFMSAGGSDEKRSSFTARAVMLTEIDKYDEAGEVSREASPVHQIEARTDSYGDRARIFGECTMSTTEGRIYNEVCVWGTNTEIFIPCIACGHFFVPTRKTLIGWQDATDIIEAGDKARIECPACKHAHDDGERLQILQRPILVSEGQSIDESGKVIGEPKRTDTFGLRWTKAHSPLVSLRNIAEAEFRAIRSEADDDKKAVMQFTWAEPYIDENKINVTTISRDMVLKKISNQPRGGVPADTQKITVFVDVGLHRCWWTAWAWRAGGEGFCIDYGGIDIPQGREANPLSILNALRDFRDEYLIHGWGDAASVMEGQDPLTIYQADLIGVDSGYQADLVYDFVRESGPNRWWATKGHGTTNKMEAWRNWTAADGRVIGNNWAIMLTEDKRNRIMHIHSDFWKRQVHDGFCAPAGGPGSLSIYNAEQREHWAFARMITAEVERQEYQPGKGLKTFWHSVRHQNHWLDCTAGCKALADMLGVKTLPRTIQPTVNPEGRAYKGYQPRQIGGPAVAARQRETPRPGRSGRSNWKIGR